MIPNNNNIIDQVPLSPILHKTASAEKLFQIHVHEPTRHRFFIKGTEITRAILEGIEEIEEYEELQDILHLFQTDASKRRFGFPGLEVAIESFEEYIRGRGEEHKEFDFYQHLLPKIAQYALEATESELIERLPLIEMHQQGSFTVKPKDVRCILANAFFLNISSEIHNFMQKDRERDFGVLDFNRLYVCRLEESIERIICQLSYFYQQANHEQQLCIDREDIVFTRHNLTVEEEPNWAEMKDIDFSNAEEAKSIIKLHDGRMEDILCRGFVDFANRFIHIGSIIPSLTQEEILFSCCPESFLTLLICESLSDTEIMTMRGMVRYSEYKGYLNTFEFTGLYEPLGHTVDIIIMDAISRKHFQPEMIKRDLNKAYLGFKNVPEKEITSGRWGCGQFGGDFVLKFVQQLCAAKVTGKSVYYSTFKDEQCIKDLTEVLESIISSKITISELYYIMSTYHEYRAINSKAYFIDYLRQELQRKK
ncbi:predicted protein [Naegleria gruberi]|uniref:poly(ADP-ribose) glycohydrolase n=1 Tax=Naegleria gruberi TaxID=5762 RepID=D2VCM9_NAEGR|nr:uncharacterized protein NAEGRDRAFT_48463 [Naegleria gruberi]EFC45448.1 predicted protein [Naegleria gruberi]|eukprot:XP_002678192.1 predicted protein [Naegleria gruberi strain NEG-M]